MGVLVGRVRWKGEMVGWDCEGWEGRGETQNCVRKYFRLAQHHMFQSAFDNQMFRGYVGGGVLMGHPE